MNFAQLAPFLFAPKNKLSEPSIVFIRRRRRRHNESGSSSSGGSSSSKSWCDGVDCIRVSRKLLFSSSALLLRRKKLVELVEFWKTERKKRGVFLRAHISMVLKTKMIKVNALPINHHHLSIYLLFVIKNLDSVNGVMHIVVSSWSLTNACFIFRISSLIFSRDLNAALACFL